MKYIVYHTVLKVDPVLQITYNELSCTKHKTSTIACVINKEENTMTKYWPVSARNTVECTEFYFKQDGKWIQKI